MHCASPAAKMPQRTINVFDLTDYEDGAAVLALVRFSGPNRTKTFHVKRFGKVRGRDRTMFRVSIYLPSKASTWARTESAKARSSGSGRAPARA